VNFRYIEFPILLKLYEEEKIVTVELGLAYARLISYKQNNVVPANIINPFKKSDTSLLLGIDYAVRNKRKRALPFHMNFRYTVSLLPITRYNWYMARSTFYAKGQFNRVFTVTLNYKIS
jgi:hypothetical protein